MNGESMNKEALINLAWNAIDKQDTALAKLEYLTMSHHAYLTAITNGLGDLSGEVEGYYFTHVELLKELKEYATTITNGFRAK